MSLPILKEDEYYTMEGILKNAVQDVYKRQREKTGIPLSAYFPAAKMAWLLQKNAEIRERAESGEICLGTIDSWLLQYCSCR